MMESVINAVFNGLLVSIPETTIWTAMVLILLKRFDLLDKYRWKENLKWLMIPVISTSIVINLFRYIITVPGLLMSIIAILTIYLAIVFILKRPENNILDEKVPYFKIFFFVILHFAVMIMLIESLYIPILLSYLKKSIVDINNFWAMNFLFSIPVRLIQFFIVILVLSAQNRKTYSSIVQSIFSDKRISITIISFISVLAIFWVILIDVFGNYNIISQFEFYQQIILNILILIVPSLLLVLMVYIILLFIEKINKLQKSHQNIIDNFDDDIYTI